MKVRMNSMKKKKVITKLYYKFGLASLIFHYFRRNNCKKKMVKISRKLQRLRFQLKKYHSLPTYNSQEKFPFRLQLNKRHRKHIGLGLSLLIRLWWFITHSNLMQLVFQQLVSRSSNLSQRTPMFRHVYWYCRTQFHPDLELTIRFCKKKNILPQH